METVIWIARFSQLESGPSQMLKRGLQSPIWDQFIATNTCLNSEKGGLYFLPAPKIKYPAANSGIFN